MSGISQMMLASKADSTASSNVFVITTATAGSIVTPAGYTKVSVEALGGGGRGFGSSTTNQRAGGGGGVYSFMTNLTVIPGTTVIYYSVGAANGGPTTSRSWVNIAANAPPTVQGQGCMAPGGGNATSGVAGTSTTTGAVGFGPTQGTSGTTGNGAIGGAAPGAGATVGSPVLASGRIAGTDTTGLSPATPMGGGNGGAYNNATTSPGTAPGGGGGGAATTGTNYSGGIGRVRIVFSP